MLVLSGEVELCVEGNIYNLEEGDLVLINSNEGHASLKKDDKSTVMVLHIDQRYFNMLSTEDKELRFKCNSLDNKDDEKYKNIRKILCKMMFSMMKNNAQGRFESLGYLSLLSSNLFEYFYEEKNEEKRFKYDKQQELLKTAIEYIQNNYRKKLYLEDMANVINYNTSYTSSFLKKQLGINFYDYLLRVRLQSAVIELITTDKPIYHIALENGFSDVKAFNASFKKNFKKSPNEYRLKSKTIQPTLAFENRSFITSDDEFIVNKLNQYLCDSEISKNIDENVKEVIEDGSIGEIKMIYHKSKQNEEFFEYLKKLNVKLNLEFF